jgi:hypothetical protein
VQTWLPLRVGPEAGFIAVHVGGGNPWNIGLLKAAPELQNLEGGLSLFVFSLD